MVGDGVHQPPTVKELGIVISNFSLTTVCFTESQAVGKTTEEHVVIMESTITHRKMLGIVKTNNVYNKPNKSTRDIF